MWLDLNALQLTRDTFYCEWLPVTKDITNPQQ